MSFIIVGRVGKPYGIKGFVKIHSFTEPSINFLNYSPWFILPNNNNHHNYNHSISSMRLNLINCKLHGNALMGQIQDCVTPEKAKQYTNLSISVHREKLPVLPQAQFYWHDLLGLDVYNLQEMHLGKIDSLLETGANHVLVIKKNDQKTILIPYVMSHYIKKIALDKNQMQVDWQEDWL